MTPTKEPLNSYSYGWALFTTATIANLVRNRIYYYLFPSQDPPPIHETTSEKLRQVKDPQYGSFFSLGRLASFAATSASGIAFQLWDSIPLSTKIVGGGVIAYCVWNKLQTKHQTQVNVANNNHINIHVHGMPPAKIEKNVDSDGNPQFNLIFSCQTLPLQVAKNGA